jgi:hypothetical protein
MPFGLAKAPVLSEAMEPPLQVSSLSLSSFHRTRIHSDVLGSGMGDSGHKANKRIASD